MFTSNVAQTLRWSGSDEVGMSGWLDGRKLGWRMVFMKRPRPRFGFVVLEYNCSPPRKTREMMVAKL